MFQEKDNHLCNLLSHACYVLDFGRATNIASLLMNTESIDGAVVELGCHQGNTAILLSNLTNKSIYVYDSFEGLPKTIDKIPFKEGDLKASEQDLIRNFNKFNTKLPFIKKGWFKDITSKDIPDRISFAHLDGDLYESMIDSLNLVYPRLAPYGCCVIDDYGWSSLPGVKRACDEFFKDKPEKIVKYPGLFGIDQGVFWKETSSEIALVCSWDKNFDQIASLTWSNIVNYCKKWNYDYFSGIIDCGRKPTWNRWKKALELLPKYKYLLILDADILIMNHTINLESFLDNNYDLILSQDVNGLNIGVVFIKNTEWSLNFVFNLWNNGLRFEGHPSPDQTALSYLLYNEPKEKWTILPQKQVNSYLYDNYPWLPSYPEGEYSHGDFILHLASISNDKRFLIFNELYKNIII